MFGFNQAKPSISPHIFTVNDKIATQPIQGVDKTRGFDCIVYKDHLVLFGNGKASDKNRPGREGFCLYDLKKQKPAEIPGQRSTQDLAMISPTSCIYERFGGVIFYGRTEPRRGGSGLGFGPSQKCRSMNLKMQENEDGFLFSKDLRKILIMNR